MTQPTVDRLINLLPRLAEDCKIHIAPHLRKDEHFWYLVARHYGTLRERIPELLELPATRGKGLDKIRTLSLAEAIDRSKEVFFLQKEAATDGLTGAFNRRALDSFILNLIKHRRPGAVDVVVLLDIDNFKKINDTYGHPLGDEVLRGLVIMLREKSRGYDMVARFGGEEFALVLPGVEASGGDWQTTVVQRVEEMRKAIESDMQKQLSQRTRAQFSEPITASFGIAVIGDDTGESKLTEQAQLEAVYQRADANLYQAKKSGRNAVVADWYQKLRGT